MRRPVTDSLLPTLFSWRQANMNKGFDSRLDQAWWVLRIGLGVGPFLAGLDKYFNLLTNWPAYISPLALKILPFSGQTFMHIVGVIEMIVGLAILTKWTRLGAYVASDGWCLSPSTSSRRECSLISQCGM